MNRPSIARTDSELQRRAACRCTWCNAAIEASQGSAYCGDQCRNEAIEALLRRERFKAMRFQPVWRAMERARLESEAAELRNLVSVDRARGGAGQWNLVA